MKRAAGVLAAVVSTSFVGAVAFAQSDVPPASAAVGASQSAPPPASGTIGAHPPVAPSSDGRLRVAVNRPHTDVIVDGRGVGEAPIEIAVVPGTHPVRLTCPGFKSWEGAAEMSAESLTTIRAQLRPAPSRQGGVAVLILSAIFTSAAGTLGALSDADQAALDMDRALGRLDNRDPRIDRGEAFAVIADVGFAVAALLGITGLYLVVHDPSVPSSAHVGRPRHNGAPP